MTRAARLAAAYAAITLLMTWPIFNIGGLASASYEGDARLIIWTLAWDNHAVLAGLPLFQSNIFYPAADSLSYNEHLFGISLFTLPIYALTHNPVLAYNIIWFLSFVLNAVATHALLRRYTASDLAAFTGSLVFTFSFYRMLQGHGHLQQIWTWLVPLSLLLLERWLDRSSWGRATAWAGAVLLQALGSWYVAVMVVMANGILLVWRLAAAPRPQLGKRLVQLAVVSGLAAAVIWPFAAHYSALAPVDVREVRSLSADAASYLMPAEHTWPGRAWLASMGRGPRSMFGERTMYLGWVALLLGAWGAVVMVTRGQWRKAGPYLVLAVVALLLSFGPPARSGWTVYSLATHLPGLAGFRAPARFGLLVLLGVSVLAAIGVDAILDRWPRTRTVALFVLPVMLSEWFVIGFPGRRPQPFAVPEIYGTPQLQTAHALVSLPDYRGDIHWFWESDYLLYSTAHWRPVVNGYGRFEPPDHAHNISHMSAFPGPNNAKTMRALGVEYVVVHAGRFPDAAAQLLRDAQASPEYDLVAHIGTDYLYRVK